MIEVYLLFFSIYVLLVGLFVQRLTSIWLWTSFGFGISSFCFFFCGFKNLILFDFFFLGLNFGSIFLFFIFFMVLINLNFSSFFECFFFWTILFCLCWISIFLFAGDFSCFQVNNVDVFWLGNISGGSFYHDFKLLLLFICFFTFIGVYHRGTHHYEYDYALLLLLATLSALLLISQDNLILIYLNLELQALILYVLTTYYRFEESSTESGLKYLLIGSFVSGFFLVGISDFYFYNGSLNLSELNFLGSAHVWLVVNFVFKLGVAPFYFWTPSVYQQMDYPSLIFIGSLPKISVWFLLFKTFSFLTVEVNLYWFAFLSIFVGALGGLYQLSLTSIIAYSGILNGGYLLLFCDQINSQVTFMISTYVIAYYLTLSFILCSFCFFKSNWIYEFGDFSMLGWLFSFFIYYLFLSLSGLPVLPGFATKVYLLGFSLERNFFEAFVIVLFSLFAVFYYLKVSSFFLFNSSQFVQKFFNINFFYYIGMIIFLNNVLHSLTSFC